MTNQTIQKFYQEKMGDRIKITMETDELCLYIKAEDLAEAINFAVENKWGFFVSGRSDPYSRIQMSFSYID